MAQAGFFYSVLTPMPLHTRRARTLVWERSITKEIGTNRTGNLIWKLCHRAEVCVHRMNLRKGSWLSGSGPVPLSSPYLACPPGQHFMLETLNHRSPLTSIILSWRQFVMARTVPVVPRKISLTQKQSFRETTASSFTVWGRDGQPQISLPGPLSSVTEVIQD